MARDLEHLILPRVQESLPRRLHGGGRSVERPNKSRHGRQLGNEAEEIVEAATERELPGGLRPELIFKVELHPNAQLDDETIDRMGLKVLAREPGKTLVVFASDGELQSFRRRLEEYAGEGGHQYAEFGGIEHLHDITPEDRIGHRLRESPLEDNETEVPLDVELWHPGSTADADERLEELRAAVADLDGRVSDSIVTQDLLLARVRLDANRLEELLGIDRVREVDLIPSSGIEPGPVEIPGIEDFPEIPEPEEGATGVLLVDSGVTPRHPLLENLIGEAAAFPGPGGEQFLGVDTESRMGGHGTAVAGRAALADLDLILSGQNAEGVPLFSARVLDDECRYDPDRLVEHQLEEAVSYFLGNYPECKVINISLGDSSLVMADGYRQFRLAARIDELAYEFRDRDILFVIASGNNLAATPDPVSGSNAYGRHFSADTARLAEPATAALALTVGGIAAGRTPDVAGRSALAGRAGYPSPFTRRGPGLDGAMKPDLVEYAGDWVLDASSRQVDDLSVGVLSTNREFAPPGGQVARRVVGTSFSAPAVSHIAARLFDRFPGASSNMIRALIADSSRLPHDRPTPLSGDPWEEQVWRVYGNGRPSYERAAASDENDVLLTAESIIDLDSFQLFELPEIPAEFLETPGERMISVTLAYDPPTRQSRADNYFGVGLDYYLFRNTPIADVKQLFRNWKKAPAGTGEEEFERKRGDLKGSQKVDLKPGITQRKRSTLQRSLCRIRNRNWQNDGDPLILAVTAQRRWAPASVVEQRFAVIISLKHANSQVKLHAPLLARQRERQRERQRARQRV